MATLETDLPKGAIVVVAKSPILGKSKTRLISLLGETGSVTLAKAMLSDVLLTISGCNALRYCRKILLYAPGNMEGMTIMKEILENSNLAALVTRTTSDNNKKLIIDVDAFKKEPHHSWVLLPMVDGDLNATDLGQILENGLLMAIQILVQGNVDNCNSAGTETAGVVFLGMDAPLLSLDDICMGLQNAQRTPPQAMLCPAEDGGYGMLCVPSSANASLTFRNLYWSHSLTAVSQIKALTDQNIMVTIGKLMYDIDEPSDVHSLCERIIGREANMTTGSKNLSFNHSSNIYPLVNNAAEITSTHPSCRCTHEALTQLGLLEK